MTRLRAMARNSSIPAGSSSSSPASSPGSVSTLCDAYRRRSLPPLIAIFLFYHARSRRYRTLVVPAGGTFRRPTTLAFARAVARDGPSLEVVEDPPRRRLREPADDVNRLHDLGRP